MGIPYLFALWAVMCRQKIRPISQGCMEKGFERAIHPSRPLARLWSMIAHIVDGDIASLVSEKYSNANNLIRMLNEINIKITKFKFNLIFFIFGAPARI